MKKIAESEKLKKASLEQRKRELLEGLPHLYGFKRYPWQKNYFNSINKNCLITAANQAGKSSIQICKAIEWAGNTALWSRLWPSKPTQFWYFYPDQDTWNLEWQTKWQEFMPKGVYKTHETYGWEPILGMKQRIEGIKFNSGVTIYCKSYSQHVSHLQASTVYAVFCDEELPIEYYSELKSRMISPRVRGYFSMVFTATLNQDDWRRAMEPRKHEQEFLPEAFKQTVSQYDCMYYHDGTRSLWTEEMIKENERNCKSKNEVLRRIYGRFISEHGRQFQEFDSENNVIPAFTIPEDWLVYIAVDGGSGGEVGHPAAIVFVAINPDAEYGVVFKAWRGAGEQTTGGDILEKMIAMRKDVQARIVAQIYDPSPASSDFAIICSRNGEPLLKADKSRAKGVDIVNTLFKNKMLDIFDIPECQPLITELVSMKKQGPSISGANKVGDDLADALRYAVVSINWAWEKVDKIKVERAKVQGLKVPEILTAREEFSRNMQLRGRGLAPPEQQATWQEMYEEETAAWNEAYGASD